MISPLKIIGVFGLLLIIIGVLIRPRNRKIRDVVYVLGGFCLVTYSIYIKDAIFIILQIVFILIAIYDFVRLKNKKKHNL
jgi:lipid-A-disaccharide synthase-like uncharacterized protein